MDNKISKTINKNRHRNIIWFNPPFCKLSNVNIGKNFLGLISKHFRDNAFRKIMNKNNVKISYSSTNNISKITDNPNKKLISKLNWNDNDNLRHSCNCKIKNECPLGNKYNLDNIVYQAIISNKENDNNKKAYIGMTSLNWKFRYYNHLQSFRNPTLKNQTALSRYDWDQIELGLTSIINWKVIKISSSINSLHV